MACRVGGAPAAGGGAHAVGDPRGGGRGCVRLRSAGPRAARRAGAELPGPRHGLRLLCGTLHQPPPLQGPASLRFYTSPWQRRHGFLAFFHRRRACVEGGHVCGTLMSGLSAGCVCVEGGHVCGTLMSGLSAGCVCVEGGHVCGTLMSGLSAGCVCVEGGHVCGTLMSGLCWVCVCGGGSRLWDFDVRALLGVCVWRGVTSVGL